MEKEKLINKLEFIVSKKDEDQRYARELKKVGMAFKEMSDGVWNAGIYFIIDERLYRKKNLTQLEFSFK